MFAVALKHALKQRKTLLPALLLIILSAYFVNFYRAAHSTTSFWATRPARIPRILHLVQLKKDAELHFSFQSFLCIYSAYHFIKPTKIFIHTDHNASSVDHATKKGSSWTRIILTAFPDTVQINPVIPPTTAANGLTLQRIEHKSDFVRMEQIAVHGGIYLDWDVLTLKSPAPLLDAGFRAVVGRQVDGNINNGCFMATKDSGLVQLMNQDMPVVFSGEWQHHSTGLITPIAERIASVPGEVLIMDQKAFAPTSWLVESAGHLFSENEEKSLVNEDNVDTVDAIQRWNNGTTDVETWEMDFSQTYFLHAFKGMGPPLPNFDGISLPYVLRRKSNYALAAWPVVMQGIEDGIINERDASLWAV